MLSSIYDSNIPFLNSMILKPTTPEVHSPQRYVATTCDDGNASQLLLPKPRCQSPSSGLGLVGN